MQKLQNGKGAETPRLSKKNKTTYMIKAMLSKQNLYIAASKLCIIAGIFSEAVVFNTFSLLANFLECSIFTWGSFRGAVLKTHANSSGNDARLGQKQEKMQMHKLRQHVSIP